MHFYCVVGHHLDYFMRLSMFAELLAFDIVHEAEKVEKIVSKAERRALEVEHETLRANRAQARFMKDTECLGRIMKEA